MHLYEINEEFRAIMDAVDPETGEMTGEQFAALDGNDMAFADKAEAVAFFIRECEAESDAIKSEADRLAKSARVKANKSTRLKTYLLECLQERDIPKIQGKILAVRRQFGGPAVEITDESKIGTEYYVSHDPTISKALIKDALKDGVDVEGAELVRHEHLRIV